MVKFLIKYFFIFLDQGLLPEFAIRKGAQLLLRSRIRREIRIHRRSRGLRNSQFALELGHNPVVLKEAKEKEAEYVKLYDFFRLLLGRFLSSSCCYWSRDIENLEEAEEAMFNLIVKRSGISPGMNILVLGTRWGGFALWLSEKYPDCSITTVAISQEHLEFIKIQSQLQGSRNLTIVVGDLDQLKLDQKFDRICALESFERVQNFGKLFRKIACWLEPEGILFIQIFCHWRFAYPFSGKKVVHWVGRNFLPGWLMPSNDLVFHFQKELGYQKQWRINGRHYSHTVEAWLKRLKKDQAKALAALEGAYGKKEGRIWLRRWKAFFLTAAELFSFKNGEEWYISQYLFGHMQGEAPMSPRDRTFGDTD